MMKRIHRSCILSTCDNVVIEKQIDGEKRKVVIIIEQQGIPYPDGNCREYRFVDAARQWGLSMQLPSTHLFCGMWNCG